MEDNIRMSKLALSDEILLSVDKSARYIGNEINSIKKDLSTVDIRFAMCFPDVYEIGSHILEYRYCMVCLMTVMIYIAKEFIHRGSI